MAKIEAERRDLLTVVRKGAEVTELKFRCSIHRLCNRTEQYKR